MQTNPSDSFPNTCKLCGGNAGTLIEGAHALCSARAHLGLPTPSLGRRCQLCQGRGRTGTAKAAPAVYSNPYELARAVEALWPECKACQGKGYTPCKP